MKTLLVFGLAFFAVFNSFAQLRSTSQSGDWHQASTWAGLSVPDNTNGSFSTVTVNHVITVRSSTYTLSNPLQIDNLVIANTGTLIVEAGAALRLQNATGADLTISGSGTFEINGTLLTNSGVSFSGLTNINSMFGSGAELRSSSVNLPIASGYEQITVYLLNFTASATLNSTWSQLTNTTNLIVNCPDLGNSAINFNGHITNLNSLQIQDTDGNAGGRVVIHYIGTSTLDVGAGGLSVIGDSRIFFNHAGSVTVNLSGDFLFSPNVGAQFSQSTSYGSNIVNFNNSDLIMSSGQWLFASSGSNGLGNFKFNEGSNINISGGTIGELGSGSAQGLIEFLGSIEDQQLSIIPTAIGDGNINFTVNKSSGNVLFTENLITTNLALTSGNLVVQNAGLGLTIRGAISLGSGVIDAVNPIEITIENTGSLPGTIPFVPNSVIRALTLNRSTANVGFSNASIEDDGLITIISGQLNSSLNSLGQYNLIYSNPLPFVTGQEIPSNSSVLDNLSINGTGSVQLSSSVTVNGILHVTGVLTTSNIVSVLGNIVNNGSILLTGGSIGFVGNTLISGTGLNDFNSLSISTGSNLTCQSDINIKGSFSGIGSFNSSATVFFNGTISLSGSGTKNFNNIVINGGSVTPNSNYNIAGNLTVNAGTLNPGNRSTIFTGNTTVSGNGSINFNSIQINGTLTFPSGNVGVRANFVNHGSFNHGNGTVTFLSTGVTKLLNGSQPLTFNNLVVQNSASALDLRNDNPVGINLINRLTLNSGAVFDADGSNNSVFTLLSSGDVAGSDATIAPLLGGASVTGNVSVQRYWGAADNVFRYISSPVTNGTVQQLIDAGILITGFSGSPFPCNGECDNNNANLSWYNESLLGNFSGGWVDFPGGGDEGTILTPGRGYGLLMWDGTQPTLWTSRGSLNQGSLTFNVSHTQSSPADPNADGWNLIGNPFPASITWEDNGDLPGGWTFGANIAPTVWMYNEVDQQWLFYNRNSNLGNFDGVISTGQAFWVQVSTPDANATLQLHEPAKATTSGAFYRETSSFSGLVVSLSKEDITDKIFAVVQSDNHTPRINMGGERMSLAFLSEKNKENVILSIDNEIETMPLSIFLKEAGDYALELSSSNLDNYYLIDKLLNKVIPAGQSYKFESSMPNLRSTDRFIISKKLQSKESSINETVISMYPNPFDTKLSIEITGGFREVSILDGVGTQLIFTSDFLAKDSMNSISFDVSSFSAGMYLVRVVKSDGTLEIKKVYKR